MRARLVVAMLLGSALCCVGQQPSMPGMDMGQHEQSPQSPSPSAGQPGPRTGEDGRTSTRDTKRLQEGENEGFHTGAELPAPELLQEVTTRPAMGLEEFVTMAERLNPTIAQARALVQRSEGQGRQAGLLPNPTVAYSGEHIRGGAYGGGEQGGYIEQEFVLGRKLGLRRQAYAQEAASERIGVDEQALRVRNDVQQSFYRALTSQALVMVRQRLLRVALDAVATAHQLANVGQADAPDVLQAEVEGEQAKVDYVHAQRDYLQDFSRLAAVAGARALVASPLKGDLEQAPAIDAEQAVAGVLAGSPTLKRAQQEVVAAEARLRVAKREAIPNLTVRAGEWSSGERIESSGRAAGPESFVEAGVRVPLWDRNQGNAEAAKADLERARENVMRTQLALQQQAEPIAQQYLAARFEAERYRTELIPRSRRAYELYLMKYQQMAAAYPQVLVSQRTLFQLQVAYLGALSTEWEAALALRNYTVSGGLDSAMGAGRASTGMDRPVSGAGTEAGR